MAALQDQQGGEIEEGGELLHRASDENDERRERSEGSIDRPEQVIEEEGPGDMEGDAQHRGCEPDAEQAFVREDVSGRRGGVAMDRKPAQDADLTECRGGALQR